MDRTPPIDFKPGNQLEFEKLIETLYKDLEDKARILVVVAEEEVVGMLLVHFKKVINDFEDPSIDRKVACGSTLKLKPKPFENKINTTINASKNISSSIRDWRKKDDFQIKKLLI